MNLRTKLIKNSRFLHTLRDYDITPEQLLFGSKYREWEHSDYGLDNTDNSILSRNNVGLGFLILNSDYGHTIQNQILYRRLRDLEVNIYKRHVVLTSMTRSIFTKGWDCMELLKLAELSQKTGEIDQKFKNHMTSLCDLIHLITTYRKPLIVYANGYTGGYGVSLWALANRAAAYNHSILKINNLDYGWIIDGGLSCILSLLKGYFGEYIALLGNKIYGSDLLHIGLGNRWVSPDAFSMMEHTSSSHLFTSEQDSKLLLEEHSLDYPEIGKDSIIYWESIINYHFSRKSFDEIIESLRLGTPCDLIESTGKSITSVKNWEKKIIGILERRPPYASRITLKLIRDAKKFRDALMKDADISPSLWLKKTCPGNVTEANHEILRESFIEELLIQCLNNELQAAQQYIMSFDIIESIRAYMTKNTENYIAPKYNDEVKNFTSCESPLWEPIERGWFSLSSIPQLRRLNPDYDESTGLDHDPSSYR